MSPKELPLVTIVGGTGNIGAPLVQKLSQTEKMRIRVVGREGNPVAYSLVKHLNVELVPVSDWKNDKQLDNATRHTWALVIIKPFIEEMVQFSTAWANAAKRERTIQHLIMLSAMGADDSATFTFAKNQRACERAVEATGISFTHVRPAFFHSNFLNFAPMIKSESKFYAPWSDKKMAGIDPRDISSFIFSVLQHPDKHVNKARTITVRDMRGGAEMASAMSKAVGRPIKYVPISHEQYRKATQPHVPTWMLNYLCELQQIIDMGYGSQLTPDLKEYTGRDGISFDQWAYENVEKFH